MAADETRSIVGMGVVVTGAMTDVGMMTVLTGVDIVKEMVKKRRVVTEM